MRAPTWRSWRSHSGNSSHGDKLTESKSDLASAHTQTPAHRTKPCTHSVGDARTHTCGLCVHIHIISHPPAELQFRGMPHPTPPVPCESSARGFCLPIAAQLQPH